jgi:hypothetical protein
MHAGERDASASRHAFRWWNRRVVKWNWPERMWATSRLPLAAARRRSPPLAEGQSFAERVCAPGSSAFRHFDVNFKSIAIFNKQSHHLFVIVETFDGGRQDLLNDTRISDFAESKVCDSRFEMAEVGIH